MKFGTRFAMSRRVTKLEQLDRLAEFEGAGTHYAATEIEARYCTGTQAVGIGGGNSAG